MPHAASKPPAAHVEWAKYLRDNVPGDVVRVHRYLDDGEQNSIAIFTSVNDEGIVAATVGVMDYSQSRPGLPPLYTEILVDGRTDVNCLPSVVSTIGFYIIKDGWKVAPGVTFADMVSMYAPELNVKHVLFVPPYQWEDRMTEVKLSDRTIYPLLAVPITDGELELVQSSGADELQELWERSLIDVLDWTREGVV